MAQAQKEASKDLVAKPRAVLRRNMILPFNKTSGWGTLPSTETFRSAESGAVPAHYVPPMPTHAVKRNSHLSWPFSAHRLSGQSMQMKKLKVSRLSTVVESPKSSPMQPMLKNSHPNASGQSIALSSDYASRHSSCQSLLQHHPAFRHQHQATGPPGTATRAIVDSNKRLQRAQSFVETPTAQMARPHLRARSASLCSQTSGMAPDVILPPLPLEFARLKSEVRNHKQLNRAPSNLSVSSFGSANSSVLAIRASPVVPHSTKFRGQKITKPNTKGSSFAGARPFRDTLDLRSKVLGGRYPPEATSPSKPDTRDLHVNHRGTLMEALSTQLFDAENKILPSNKYNLPTPNTSPLRVRDSVTPKRRSKTQVTSSGSPERQYPNLTNPRMAGGMRSPKRQHSQASSRSSGGNPFQWDPTPILTAGKPSALKGSPGARKGHGRKNSVRISLVPIFHGPPSRDPSQSLSSLHQGDLAEGVPMGERSGVGLGLENARALPTPPTSSTFAPDLKFTATSLRATLTATSPTLPLVGYDQSFVVFPTDQVLPQLSEKEQKRLSNGSMFSLSRFPVTPSIIEPADVDSAHPTEPTSQQTTEFSGHWVPDTPLLQQHPFGVHTPDRNQSPSPTSVIDLDEYDPAQPSCIYQTPPNPNNISRSYQSAFAPIPEESSICSSRVADIDQPRTDDSPRVSPKTISPPRLSFNNRSAYNLPIHATCIPEEFSGTIDPSVLSKDSFSMLNSEYSIPDDSIFGAYNSNHLSIAMPSSSGSAQLVFDPLLAAAFPASPPLVVSNDSPTIGHQSDLSISVYSSRSRSPSPVPSPIELPSPVFPCSPRPSHAQLPGARLSINFADVPKLHPSPVGPRGSPPRPLRSSIAQLRRMNSDAVDAKNSKAGRGERRYLRLGREDSMQVPGDESWLDELDEDNTVELDEVEGRRLVGDLLEDFDEGQTVLDLNDGNMTVDSISTIRASPTPSQLDITEQDTIGGASSAHSSSIWEDSEKFWTSSTPTSSPRPNSPKKPRNDTYQPLTSSPIGTPKLNSPATPRSAHRKRHFEVAKDDIPNQRGLYHQSIVEEENIPSPRSKKNGRRHGVVGGRYRKRAALGVGTANEGVVRIQVTSPGGHVLSGNGTPGSLYDHQGFLRL